LSLPELIWTEGEAEHRALWRSESAPVPRRIALADDGTRADAAFRQCAEGTSLLYRGDYHNARQLLSAMGRRVKPPKLTGDLLRDFHLHRQAQGRDAQILGRLLICIDSQCAIPMRRAPDVQAALAEAWEPVAAEQVTPLRELLGVIGAHEWRRRGVEVSALGARVHPHYGVFAPVRGEYVQLVADAPLKKVRRAFDIGTGTGVLALVLARRGIPEVVATDLDARALASARENIQRLGEKRIAVLEADLWPPGLAELIVCNPPWLPGRPTSRLEHAIYDPESIFLKRFIQELPAHLAPGGEGWLVISDLAERLGLRSPTMLAELFSAAGLVVIETLEARPTHARTRDTEDPLHAARSAEVTRLFRLRAG
jgi:methylase of polypeptide subunit release factors